ncbi:hypothetical protein [Desulfitobacterium metallireducens]|uniref:Uncharacterized protein n=1 Tax=Desulfitobacterium metallireducens DSM 15288 TaxID=871968 RepID=W0EHN7_9FIRM|nr:hypothetical protein [Desulfitobacterium metallireducens]AHF08704.1 hypothetical protein DESME_15060 [Desulfitobacterium metallireducens DSM 15288]
MLNQDDRMTLTLLNLEIIGSLTAIIGLILFIVASTTAKDILLSSYFRRNPGNSNLNPDVTAFLGRLFFVAAGFIAASTTTLRLIQRAQKVLRHEPMQGTLVPITYIVIGSWTSLFGGIIALIGDYRRVQESPSSIPVY